MDENLVSKIKFVKAGKFVKKERRNNFKVNWRRSTSFRGSVTNQKSPIGDP